VRLGVGVMEATTFARYEVSGTGASAWLDAMMAVSPPAAGRIVLAPMLNDEGRLAGDFTLANAGAGASCCSAPAPRKTCTCAGSSRACRWRA
jgi:dimethylglycine dehydrogenase